MAELPPRINFEERKIRVYKFSELLNEQSENLKSNYYGSIVFIDDPELLKSNIDFLKLLLYLQQY